MGKDLLEAGVIVNTHGLRGEVRILPWADSPEFVAKQKCLYVDGAPITVVSARVHKSSVIAVLEGIGDIDSAIKLKNKTVSIDRSEVLLDEGQYFIADLIGLRVIDAQTGDTLGILEDVMSRPANDVYIVKGEREILIPAVDEFVLETSISGGYIKVRLIEGL